MENTYLHRLDVRSKIAVLFGMLFPMFIFSDPVFLLGLIVLLMLVILPARLSLDAVFKTIRAMFVICLLIIVMTCFTATVGRFVDPVNKTVILSVFGINATLGGLKTGVAFFLRMFLMIFLTVVFTITTPIDDILQMLNKMKASYELSIIVTTAISFIPTMTNKKNMIFQAQRSRGAKLNGKGVIGQLKAYVPIMVPLITNSILMANNLAVSMMNRGYGASSNWTSLHEITMHRRDYLVIASTVLIIALSFILKYTYHFGVI